MDLISVITLGKLAKQPLIGPPSELVDGYEPHDMIYSRDMTAVTAEQPRPGAGVYPGSVQQVGTRRGTIPGTTPSRSFEAYLMEFRL